MNFPVDHIQVPGLRFSHVDLIGPLPKSNGSPTSSPSLIIQPDGQRQFLFTQLQKIVLKSSYAHGFLCSECHQWLSLIAELSSQALYVCNSLSYYFLPSSIWRNCGEVPSSTQGFPPCSTCWVWLFSSSSSGSTWPSKCSQKRLVNFSVWSCVWFSNSSTVRVPG